LLTDVVRVDANKELLERLDRGRQRNAQARIDRERQERAREQG
jgi:hypothetical protein